jgi:hypothetical protein
MPWSSPKTRALFSGLLNNLMIFHDNNKVKYQDEFDEIMDICTKMAILLFAEVKPEGEDAAMATLSIAMGAQLALMIGKKGQEKKEIFFSNLTNIQKLLWKFVGEYNQNIGDLRLTEIQEKNRKKTEAETAPENNELVEVVIPINVPKENHALTHEDTFDEVMNKINALGEASTHSSTWLATLKRPFVRYPVAMAMGFGAELMAVGAGGLYGVTHFAGAQLDEWIKSLQQMIHFNQIEVTHQEAIIGVVALAGFITLTVTACASQKKARPSSHHATLFAAKVSNEEEMSPVNPQEKQSLLIETPERYIR